MPDRNTDQGQETVRQHYGKTGLEQRILEALTAAGKSIDPLSLDDLSLIDEFHTRGRAATKDLVRMLQLKPGERVLDLGCGIGGPARFLTKTCGVQVSAVDLTPEFIATAKALSARVGIADAIDFQVADALHVPFGDATFDVVWSQNVAMNIADRPGLYAEIRRVLKPGGRYAFTDVTQGQGGALHYPQPWAATAETSHLLTIEQTRAALTSAGFSSVTIDDQTADAEAQSIARGQREAAGTAPKLGIHVIVGPTWPQIVETSIRNYAERRMGAIQAVAVRA